MFKNQLTGRTDIEIIALVKSSVFSLYLLLKPKIFEYAKKLTSNKFSKEESLSPDSLTTLTQHLDRFLLDPSKLSIEQTIQFADIINLFCHEYGITRITYFIGSSQGDSISNI